jgi:hypothetical protein
MRNCLLVTYKSPTSSYEKFIGHKFDRIDTLHAFGVMASYEDHPSLGMRRKLQDRGKPALVIGTTDEHPRDMQIA